MEVDNIKICRLCLNVCQAGFENVNNSTLEALDILLLDVNLDISHEPVVCSICIKSLKKCFDFKVDCLLKRNSTHMKYRNLDLSDPKSHLSENSAASVSDCNICGFCMKLLNLDSSVPLENEEKVIISKYLPELDLNLTEGSITCTSCYKSLQILVSFINNCVAVEQKVQEYCSVEGTNGEGQIELNGMLSLTFKSELKSLDSREFNLSKVEEDSNQLENENKIEIKAEDCMELEEHELSYIKENSSLKYEDDVISENGIEQDTKMYSTKSLRTHMLLRKIALQVVNYKCLVCEIQAKHKPSLQNHEHSHKDTTNIRIFKSKVCACEAKCRDGVRKQILTHASELRTLMCNACSFQTKYRSRLQSHMLAHKSKTEVTMHKCEICEFETKYKANMEYHMLSHKSTSEVTMFSCNMCPFQSKYKCSLKPHMLTHASTSEVRMFVCAKCQFQSKYKVGLQQHILTHKSRTEVTMHKCNMCEFETKYKSNISKHMLTHKNASEVRIFKCDKCPH